MSCLIYSFAECGVLFIIKLTVVIVSFILLSVTFCLLNTLNVAVLSVMFYFILS